MPKLLGRCSQSASVFFIVEKQKLPRRKKGVEGIVALLVTTSC